MKDIHSHILYGIDDGSVSIENSIKLLNKLESEGVTDLVLTPHYITGSKFDADNKKKRELLNTLKDNTNINLYLGNEVYIDNNIIENIKNDNISTINNTRYILVELPLGLRLSNDIYILSDLIRHGYIPVIAHPERYLYLSINELKKYLDIGCIFECNITSFTGKYGFIVKRRVIKLFDNKMISVVGSDTHKEYFNVKYNFKESNYVSDILCNNFEKIVNDIDIRK